MYLSLTSLLASGLLLAGEPANTDWMHAGRYGAFMHFLPGNAGQLALVDQFDVEALAKQLDQMGAAWFCLTLGQNSGFMNSPNATYDRLAGYAPGERLSKRDLPLALYEALAPRKIKLMLYLPCQVPNRDRQAQKAFGLREGPADQPIDLAFAAKWAEVIQEWSDRYGDKVAGWWFDGGYQHIHFSDAIADVYNRAVKHGNPRALASFNPGVKLIRWTKAEDYTAGELNEPFGYVPTERFVKGSQWQALTYLGQTWAQRNVRYKAEQWAAWVAKVVAHDGAITFDMGPNWDPKAGPIGTFAADQVAQFAAIRAAAGK